MDFGQAIKGLLDREGGLVDDPHDSGRATKYGISLALLEANGIDLTGDGVVDEKDIQALTLEQAKEIYRVHFWDWLRCGELPSPLAVMVFDFGVNVGRSRAARFLQVAVKKRIIDPLIRDNFVVDGIIGPQTVQKARLCHERDRLSLAAGLMSKILAHYPDCKTWPHHGRGWINRWSKTLAEVSTLEEGA